jgi:membrane dipeptidase
MIFDSHLDLGAIIHYYRFKGYKNVLKEIFLDEFKRNDVRLIIAAIYVDDIFVPEMALKEALLQIRDLKYEIDLNKKDFFIVKDKLDLMSIMENDKIGIIISLEGLDPIGNNLDLLDTFYDLGVRGVGFSWSRRNYIADGTFTGTKSGLTRLGLDIIKYINDKNMYIDISHLNDKGIDQVLKYSKKPIMASHSNSRTLCSTERNLSDNQIEKIIEKNGFIGCVGIKGFVSSEEPNISNYVKHINWIISKGGDNCVGFGFDMCNKFNGIDIITNISTSKSPSDIIDSYDLVKNVNELLNQDVIENINYKNLYNFLIRVL